MLTGLRPDTIRVWTKASNFELSTRIPLIVAVVKESAYADALDQLREQLKIGQ